MLRCAAYLYSLRHSSIARNMRRAFFILKERARRNCSNVARMKRWRNSSGGCFHVLCQFHAIGGVLCSLSAFLRAIFSCDVVSLDHHAGDEAPPSSPFYVGAPRGTQRPLRCEFCVAACECMCAGALCRIFFTFLFVYVMSTCYPADTTKNERKK